MANINPNTKVKVKNRIPGISIYNIPEKHIRREFFPREEKWITFGELSEAAQQPGGRELIYHNLYIEDENVLHELITQQEQPEYWLTEDKLPGWMTSCSLDEFKDCLDYAPDGIKSLVKKLAVELPLKDTDKIDAIKAQLGFDVSAALARLKEAQEDGDETPAATKNERRSAPSYKVVKSTILNEG